MGDYVLFGSNMVGHPWSIRMYCLVLAVGHQWRRQEAVRDRSSYVVAIFFACSLVTVW